MKQTTRIGAYGLIVNADKVLLCRISSALPKSAGEWTLPGGGVDFGEDPKSGMLREVFEETGLTVGAGELVAVDSVCSDYDTYRMHSIRILYKANYEGGDLRFEQDGTTDKCEWFTQAQTTQLPLVDLTKLGLQYVFT